MGRNSERPRWSASEVKVLETGPEVNQEKPDHIRPKTPH